MTSYQRRLRDIKYLEQCVRELEDMVKAIRRANPKLRVPLSGGGLRGDDFITPYTGGGFDTEFL